MVKWQRPYWADYDDEKIREEIREVKEQAHEASSLARAHEGIAKAKTAQLAAMRRALVRRLGLDDVL